MSYFELMGFGPNGWGGLMLKAAAMTVAVSSVGFLIGSVIGALVAWAKIAGNRPLVGFADGYTTVLRGIPDLLVIYLFYFGGSALLSAIHNGLYGTQGFVSIPGFLAGAAAVGVTNGAYQAEVFRGAFTTIAKGELEAARAIGMGRFTLFHRIVAPQVLRFAIPGLGNCWQLCLKESALISVTGLVELLRQSFIGGRSTRDFFSFLLTGAALYLVITTVSSFLFDRAEKRALRGFRRA